MLLRAAAVPTTEARERVAALVESVVAPGKGVTPIPADRRHVVVAQFGNLPNEEVPRLSSTLALSLMRGKWAGAETAAGPLYEEFEFFRYPE